MLAIASEATVAAKGQMPPPPRLVVARNRPRRHGCALRRSAQASASKQRFAAVSLCPSYPSSFKPVGWAAVRRQVVPTVPAQGQSHRSVVSSASPSGASATRPVTPALGFSAFAPAMPCHFQCWLTLHSSGTSTGMALGPRGAAGLCSASRAKRHSGVGPSAQTLGSSGMLWRSATAARGHGPRSHGFE